MVLIIFVWLIVFFSKNTDACWVMVLLLGIVTQVFVLLLVDIILKPFRWLDNKFNFDIDRTVRDLAYYMIVFILLKIFALSIVLNYYTESIVL